MPLDQLIANPITGIEPFDELPINAERWREAHEHHHLHRRLHAASSHRPGIVSGLEVVASRSSENTLLVAPGVAIDQNGQTVVLSKPWPIPLAPREYGQIYVVLWFEPTHDEEKSAVQIGSVTNYYRLIESREVQKTRELPTTAYLELARFNRTGPGKPVTDAAVPAAPGDNELNLLQRRLAFPFCHADLRVGELSYAPVPETALWHPNRTGLWHLLRAGNSSGFHLDFVGPCSPDSSASPGLDPDLLYMAGQSGFEPFSGPAREGLERFLDNGGLLVGEACGGSREFEQAFLDLARQLGARQLDPRLHPLPQGHALLTAHHVFSAPPPGARSQGVISLDEARGILFSNCDYGGAWQGAIEDAGAADARQRIRAAEEFGLNVLAFAARRRRRHELTTLEGF